MAAILHLGMTACNQVSEKDAVVPQEGINEKVMVETGQLGTTYYMVRDITKSILVSVQPEHLPVLEKMLVKDGRIDDAKNLHNTYNFKTGKMLSTPYNVLFQEKNKLKSVNWLDINSMGCEAHVQNLAWMEVPAQQYWAGTAGQSLRLEAIRLKNKTPNFTPPDIRYGIYMSNYAVDSNKTWGQTAGTVGQSLTTWQVQFYSNTPGYRCVYDVHVGQGRGNRTGYADGAWAGEQGYRLEAYQLHVYFL